MKIGPTDHSALIGTPAVSERKPAPARLPGQPEVVQSTRVDLSENVAIKANGEGSFDQAKVDRISQAIREGTFKVDAGAIADKLISNAQELLGRVSR
jgi:negative regulator of flagellin synthesis FlgM